MKVKILLFMLFCFGGANVYCNDLIKSEPFLLDENILSDSDILFYTLNVPEDWENEKSNQIQLAVAVIKAKGVCSSAPILFIQGGPGGGSINTMSMWLNHPLRKTSDIVLLDIRGTGFTKPSLCPSLGKKLLNIMAKNYTRNAAEKVKVELIMACRDSLLIRDIDIRSYNSRFVANDIHALKEALGYSILNIYGVSYGTYIAQVYSTLYPSDIDMMILDSPIADISDYYICNTQNYINSLEYLFETYNDDDCNSSTLEAKFYNVISNLENNPIHVKVSNDISSNGIFTFNAEDFKLIIQQSFYHKELIEIIPLIINQFNDRNEISLSILLNIFIQSFSLDYGTYYCFTCNDIIPFNNFELFKGAEIKEGEDVLSLSFYKSDICVCKKWNELEKKQNEKIVLANRDVKTLIFSGLFDPITSHEFAKQLSSKIKNNKLISLKSYGHSPSFSIGGSEIVYNFIKNKSFEKINCDFMNNSIHYLNDVSNDRAITKIVLCLLNSEIMIFIPLLIALLILLVYCVLFLFSIKKNVLSVREIIYFICCVLILATIMVIGYCIFASPAYHPYILSFGIPSGLAYIYYGMCYLSLIAVITCNITFGYNLIKFGPNVNSVTLGASFLILLVYVYMFYF